MAGTTTKPRRTRTRARRRAQPYHLLWIVVAFAAFVGARQLGPWQHSLVSPPPAGSADYPELVVETTHLDGQQTSGPPPPDLLASVKELAMSGRFGGSSIGSGELRWVPSDTVPFVADPILGAQVNQRIAGRSGRYGVAIKDLRTGRGVLVDPDGRYEAASLFKLSVMYEVFRQREAGNLSFSEPLILTQRHVDFDLGTLDRPAGAAIGLGEAVERMVTISDNSSAILLSDRVGAGNITADNERLGMLRTHFSSEDLSTSPRDMLTFFETIARGEGVNRDASADMLYLLARQRVNDRLPRLLPPGAIVAHKTGNLPGVVNDAGIVYVGDQAFVIAVLVEGTQQDGEAARITSELAALALDHFRSIDQRTDIPVQPLGDVVPQPAPWPTARPAPTPLPTPTASPTMESVEEVAPSRTADALSTRAPTPSTPTTTSPAAVGGLASPSPASTSTSQSGTMTQAPIATVGERTMTGPERRVPGGGAATPTPTSAGDDHGALPSSSPTPPGTAAQASATN